MPYLHFYVMYIRFMQIAIKTSNNANKNQKSLAQLKDVFYFRF